VAGDGFPIYGSKIINGNTVTIAQLDACSGITSPAPELPKCIFLRAARRRDQRLIVTALLRRHDHEITDSIAAIVEHLHATQCSGELETHVYSKCCDKTTVQSFVCFDCARHSRRMKPLLPATDKNRRNLNFRI
jgi:hypothetical protein